MRSADSRARWYRSSAAVSASSCCATSPLTEVPRRAASALASRITSASSCTVRFCFMLHSLSRGPRAGLWSATGPVGLPRQGGALVGDEALAVGVPDGVCPVPQGGLCEQVVDVRLHGRLADEQPKGDLAVGQPLRDQ